MKKLLILLSFSVLIFSCKKNDSSLAEQIKVEKLSPVEQNICFSSEFLKNEIAANPKRAAFLEDLELKTQSYKGRDQENSRIAGKLYLPLVIHIVLPDPTIVSNAQILSGLDVFNKDFNKQNIELSNPSVYLAGYSYTKVAACNIEFYITDVVRKSSSVGYEWGSNDMKFESIGGSNAIDPLKKLNIWLCDLLPKVGAYSTAPGSAADISGIVIDYEMFGRNYFGNYYPGWEGRMATHQLGHWLNLYDISPAACGDDYVTDTPLHDHDRTYYDSKPADGLRSTCKAKPLMQWMNFMNPATKGPWIYMFTEGQKNRMDAAIDNARKPYFSTTKLYTDLFP